MVGASSGMGKAVAATFSDAGARVIVAARRKAELEALCSQFSGISIACPTDVRDVVSVDNLIGHTLKVHGRIDILVYATGTNIPERSLEEISHNDWDMMLATNATGAFNCTKAVLPTMQAQQAGLIIYISSTCVQAADVSGVAYQASKHALTGLANGTYQEQRKHGIRTSIVFPGFCDTPLVLKRPAPTPPEILEKALQPQDVADACLYIATAPPRTRVAELILQPAGL